MLLFILGGGTHMQRLCGSMNGQTPGSGNGTYVKVKLWLDRLGRGHHCMGNDETTEDAYGRALS